jgi:ferredoxin-NADP reductase
MQNLTVRALRHHTDELFELQLERAEISFAPGTCLALFNDAGESRPYSIAAGTREAVLRFLIRRVPGGEVSCWLAQRKPGDRVQVSEPFGWFRPGQSEPGEEAVFIATGTGIAPFLSYLRSFPQAPPRACFYGVSWQKEAFALEELRKLPYFYLAVSRQSDSGDFHGRVTGLLDSLPLGPQIHYYLCGLDAMIDAVSDWLEVHQVDYTHIHREVFFYAEDE